MTGNYSLKGPGQNLQLSRFVRTNTAAFEPPAAGAVLAPYVEPHAQPLSGAQVDTVIDVLVLYTDAVRLYLESVGGGPGASRQFAQSAVDMVQSAMDASTTPGDPVIANVRLVGARVVSRTSTGDLNADQRWLDNDPEPLALRDFYSADIVMYLTSSGQGTTFGTANVPGFNLPPPGPGFAPSAHASLVVRCAVQPLASDCPDPYIFAHELGHLFGANHNPEVPTSPTPVEPWAFAHWAHNNVDGGGAHTLVAYYVSSCAPAASQCPIVLKYSNAQVYDDWFRTGVTNQRENARVIAEFAPTTAQYRLDVGRIFYDGFQY